MPLKESLLRQVLTDLTTGDEAKQTQAAQHIRDLCGNSEHYQSVFSSSDAVGALVGLLDLPTCRAAPLAAQSLALLARRSDDRPLIRDAGGIENLVEVLRRQHDVSEAMLDAVLRALSHFASDPVTREQLMATGLLTPLIKLLGVQHCEEVVVAGTALLQHCAFDHAHQDAIREGGGLALLIRRLSNPVLERPVLTATLQALVVLVAGNTDNQDELRVQSALPPVLKQLQLSPFDGATEAAADLLRAACQGNEANKSVVRKEWGIPLLVLLIGPAVPRPLVERAIDCLRILTTNSDENRGALIGCNSALPYLLSLMDEDKTSEVMMERTAAVVANLSGMMDTYAPLRESGIVQKLVKLLEHGPDSKVTQHAATALANLVQEPHTAKSVRLAGGVPPLLQLLLETADRRLQAAAELALERLAVTDMERNAILDAFRFADARFQRLNVVSLQLNVAGEQPTDARRAIGPLALPHYAPADVAALLRGLCVEAVDGLEVGGVTGGDLLELSEQELVVELGWSRLQAKKVDVVRRAFALFNRISHQPGSGQLSFLELQKYLEGAGVGMHSEDVESVLDGLRRACVDPSKGVVTFQDFALNFLWLQHTVEAVLAKYQPSSAVLTASAGAVPLSKASNGVWAAV